MHEISRINETHAAELRSWVASANAEACDFPIQNLPFAVFRRRGGVEPFRGGVAIGDRVLDLGACTPRALLSGEAAAAAAHASGGLAQRTARDGSARLVRAAPRAVAHAARGGAAKPVGWSLPGAAGRRRDTVPARVGDYTDMYTSVHHATNIGRLFRPDNPLMPNFKWLPVGYHGRASSIGVSGQAFRTASRPGAAGRGERTGLHRLQAAGLRARAGDLDRTGQRAGRAGPHRRGRRAHLRPVPAQRLVRARHPGLGVPAARALPGEELRDDDLARGSSRWRRSRRIDASGRGRRRIRSRCPTSNRRRTARAAAFDVTIESWLETPGMRGRGPRPVASFPLELPALVLDGRADGRAPHGRRLQPAGGRPDRHRHAVRSRPSDEAAALIELTAGGKKPLALPDGETRTFLEDGDAVILRGWCEKAGFARVGFGECRGVVLPARA